MENPIKADHETDIIKSASQAVLLIVGIVCAIYLFGFFMGFAVSRAWGGNENRTSAAQTAEGE